MVDGEEVLEEDEVGRRMAHREGSLRLAGQAGLEKFFWEKGEATKVSSSSWKERRELMFRTISPFCEHKSHTHILEILSQAPTDISANPPDPTRENRQILPRKCPCVHVKR